MKLSQKEFFDVTSGAYDSVREGNKISQHHVDAITSIMKRSIEANTRDAKILEVGVGTGVYATRLVATASKLIGLDYSQGMVTKARNKELETVLGNAHNLPFGGGVFDVCFMVDVLHHVEDPIAMLNECSRVLKNNGHLLIAEPNFTNPWVFIYHKIKKYERILRHSAIQDLLICSGFALKEKFYVNYVPTIVPNIFYRPAIAFEKFISTKTPSIAATVIFHSEKSRN
jgi:ubiquinone/menaquinone biosynthesis C-methylase UbiE